VKDPGWAYDPTDAALAQSDLLTWFGCFQVSDILESGPNAAFLLFEDTPENLGMD
jgi:hypothetical protein